MRTRSEFYGLLVVGLFLASHEASAQLELSISGSPGYYFGCEGVEIDSDDSEYDFGTDGTLNFSANGVADNGLEYGSRLQIDDVEEGPTIDESFVFLSGSFGDLLFPAQEPPPTPSFSCQLQIFSDVQRDYLVTVDVDPPPDEVEYRLSVNFAGRYFRSNSFAGGSGLSAGAVVFKYDRDTQTLGDELISYSCAHFGFGFNCLNQHGVATEQQTDLSDMDSAIFDIQTGITYSFTDSVTSRFTLNLGHWYQHFGAFDTPGQRLQYDSPTPTRFKLTSLTPGVTVLPVSLPEPAGGSLFALLVLGGMARRRRSR